MLNVFRPPSLEVDLFLKAIQVCVTAFRNITNLLLEVTLMLICHTQFLEIHNFLKLNQLRLDYGGQGPFCSTQANLWFFHCLLKS